MSGSLGALRRGVHGLNMLDLIVESSNGDIRSAIMALQFACTSPSSDGLSSKKGKAKSRRGGADTRALLEAVTRREQSLALFHLIGKILYNKRTRSIILAESQLLTPVC